jgi:hypothetical protein
MVVLPFESRPNPYHVPKGPCNGTSGFGEAVGTIRAGVVSACHLQGGIAARKAAGGAGGASVANRE